MIEGNNERNNDRLD